MKFLIEWMRENHPAVLEEWMDLEDLMLVDLDVWLEELHGAIDMEYQAYLEGED